MPLIDPYLRHIDYLRVSVTDKEIDIKTPLRAGATRSQLMALLDRAVACKPRQNEIHACNRCRTHQRAMHAIGG